ncbi:MAG: hypothetical protein WBE04_12675, partial [Methyloceanibacter sp.]
ASVLINKDPRDIKIWQKLTTVCLLLSGLVLSLAGLSGALWIELREPGHAKVGNAVEVAGPSSPSMKA